MSPVIAPGCNPLVDFLRTYGPVPAANSIWDEHVVAEADRSGVRAIEVTSDKLDELVANFRSSAPCSVVLTGTAGDGKTWHCRQLFMQLGGDPETWETSGPLLEMPLGGRKLVIVKDLSQFYGRPELPALMARVLPALLGEEDGELFLLAANDGQLLRFWRQFADQQPEARRIEERIRVMLNEDRAWDPALPTMRMYNLSRQSHDELFDRVVDAIANHPDWARCDGCPVLPDSCAIRRNRDLLANRSDPGIRHRLGQLIRLAAYNDSHLPMRHVLMLAVNVILGVSGTPTALMRCATAHALAQEREAKASNPYDNALGLNVPPGTHEQYRAFTVFEDMGIGKETNNAIDAVLVEAQPPELHQEILGSDPVFGNGAFEKARLNYQRGKVDATEFREFQASIEQQRRRLFFTMKQGRPGSSVDPWKLTLFSYGGEYLDFAAALKRRASIDFVRSRLVVGLNRSYTGAMCDESQHVWFASPAANTQSRIGRVLEVLLPVGRRPMLNCYFEFLSDPDLAGGRPQMAVRTAPDGDVLATNSVTPLLFEYLLRVQAGSLPGASRVSAWRSSGSSGYGSLPQ